MLEIDWDVLLPAIKNRTCILFLGPDAYPLNDKQSVEEAMWQRTTQDPKLIRKFYADEGLVLFHKKSKRPIFIEKIEGFYQDSGIDWSLTRTQLSKLIHIPFLTVVNLTFDNLLSQSFELAELDYKDLAYIFRPSQDDDTKLVFDNHKTSILNLLGNLDSSDNLVLTHEDLFDFLRNLFADKDIGLKEQIVKADCFLFIGVPFEKWYMQLLLQLLAEFAKAKPLADKVEKYATQGNKPNHKSELYSHELKIQFVEENPKEVIDELFRYSQEKGILNKPLEVTESYKNKLFRKIHLQILRGDIARALSQAMSCLSELPTQNNKDRLDTLTMLTARFNSLEKNKDTTSTENYRIEFNSITKSLLAWLAEHDC